MNQRPGSADWKNGWCWSWFVVREKHCHFAGTVRLAKMKESNGTFDISVQVSTTTLAPILSTSELGPWLCSYLSQTKWKVKQNNSRNHQCLPCSGVHPLSLSKLIHQNKLTSSSDRKMQSSSVRKTATTLSSLEDTAEWIIRIHAQLKLLLSHGLRTQAKHVVCPCYHLCFFVFICEWTTNTHNDCISFCY